MYSCAYIYIYAYNIALDPEKITIFHGKKPRQDFRVGTGEINIK